MRELLFIQACPLDKYYIFQTHMWLESLKNIGKSNKAISVIYIPKGREKEKDNWNNLISLYPEAQFSFYEDTDNLNRHLGIYIPIIRPYVLMKYFKEHPEMQEKAIFYCDCDILFTERFNIDAYLEDDVCYLSNTLSYINASYFDSKIKDVLPNKLEEYKKIDVLDSTCKLVGVTREIAEKNNLHSGGAQYLLKNIDWQFWDKCITDCLNIRKYLQSINRYYFESENRGIQSWASDMWAVLYGLWARNQETKIIPEMEFAWSSDPISKLDKVGIFHNAGIVSEKQGEIPVFYKGKYHMGKSPFSDPYLEYLANNEQNKTLCNSFYVEQLIKLKIKYNLQ
jgi:hypothetical protein